VDETSDTPRLLARTASDAVEICNTSGYLESNPLSPRRGSDNRSGGDELYQHIPDDSVARPRTADTLPRLW